MAQSQTIEQSIENTLVKLAVLYGAVRASRAALNAVSLEASATTDEFTATVLMHALKIDEELRKLARDIARKAGL